MFNINNLLNNISEDQIKEWMEEDMYSLTLDELMDERMYEEDDYGIEDLAYVYDDYHSGLNCPNPFFDHDELYPLEVEGWEEGSAEW